MKKNFTESTKILTEEINTDSGIISGIAVSYGKETRNGTVYDSNVSYREKLPLLFNHDHDKVIGYVNFEKTKTEVLFEAHFNLDTELGKEKFSNVKHGDLDGVSIGALGSYEWNEETEQLLITDYELIELSVVTVPANDEARIKTIESFKKAKKENEKQRRIKMTISEMIEDLNEKKAKLKKEQSKIKNLTEKANGDNVTSEDLKEICSEIENKKELTEQLEKEIKDEEENIVAEKMKVDNLRAEIKANAKVKTTENKGVSNMQNDVNAWTESKKEKIFKDSFVEGVKNKGGSFKETFLAKAKKEGFSGDVDKLFPKNVVTEITDLMRNAGTLMPFIERVTGVTSWQAMVNKSEELGYGWKGNSTEKTQQNNELEAVEIVTQYVYKYVRVSREMLDQPNDVLYNYVIKELAQRLTITIERAIVTGDGLETTDGKKITSFNPMRRETSDDFVTVASGVAIDGDTLDKLNGLVSADYTTTVVAVMNKATYTKMKLLKEVNGFRSYERGTVVVGEKTYNTLNGYIIVEKEFMADDEIVEFASMSYLMASYQTDAEMILDFELKTNTREFLTEVRAGGDVTKLKSTAVLLAGAVGGK